MTRAEAIRLRSIVEKAAESLDDRTASAAPTLLRRLKLQQQRHLQQKLKRLLKLSNQEIRPDIVKALTIEFAGAFSFLQEKYRQKHDSSKKILTLY